MVQVVGKLASEGLKRCLVDEQGRKARDVLI